jgi:hypothetical protein
MPPSRARQLDTLKDAASHVMKYGPHQASPSLRAVPELTRSVDIQLNKRLSLRRDPEMLSQLQIVGGMNALGVIEGHG